MIEGLNGNKNNVSNLNILIVEDEPIMRITLSDELSGYGHKISAVEKGEKAIELIDSNNFDIAILDIRLPGLSGMDILKVLKDKSPRTLAIMMTGYGSVTEAVEAMKAGAYDYIIKPFTTDELLLTIEKASNFIGLWKENIDLKLRLKEEYGDNQIVYSSTKFKEIMELVKSIADHDVTVLIHGETGTGKELIANAIHYNSPRKGKPFIKVNCSALPETLLESELFGHEKGAFTGAIKQKPGRFELANGGTLFLDEIAEISNAVQMKLLRVLQEREFDRVGGTKTIKVDVRIICASKSLLEEEVSRGRFREDLFYRLNVIPILLPPLRERREDIIPLVNYFVEKYSEKFRKSILGVEQDVYDIMTNYNWPGNVRELEGIIQRAITLTKTLWISKKDIPDFLVSYSEGTEIEDQKTYFHPDGQPITLDELLSNSEKEYIKEVLRLTKGQKTKAAKILGISRKSLWQKMKELSVEN